MSNHKTILSYVLLALIIIRLAWVALLADWSMPNLAKLGNTYAYSQYCLSGLRTQFSLDKTIPEITKLCSNGVEFRGNIDDPELYLLAGQEYVQGASPTAVSWELQPLTKYLFGAVMSIGLSPLVVQWGMFALLSFTLFVLGRKFGLTPSLALVAPTLLAFDGLIEEQLTRPYLDLTQVTLITLSLALLIHAIKSKEETIPFAVVLGLVALSKSFAMGIVLGGVGGIAIFLLARPRFWEYLKSLIAAVAIYLLGYSAFFIQRGIFNFDFVNLHITILKFYKSYVPEYPWGEIWRVLLLGQWRAWWGDKGLAPVVEWNLLWPMSIASLVVASLIRKLRDNATVSILIIWVISYLIFASIRLVFPRYLLPIMPMLYLTSAIMIGWVLSLFSSTKKVKST